jgi:hypothetical protein
MLDLSDPKGRLTAMPPPPPDETERRKLELIASIHPGRIKRIMEVAAAGVDPGTMSRQFNLPVSIITLIVSDPKKVYEAQHSPMTLGRAIGAVNAETSPPVSTHRPGVSPNPPPLRPVPGGKP